MTDESHEDLEAKSALFALDLLTPTERAAVESELDQDAKARALATGFENTAALLSQSVPEKQPPPALRERLLARLHPAPPTEAPVRVDLSPGLMLVFAERMAWQETGVPGIKVKPLYVDPARRYASSLVSMTQGAIYPRHRHRDLEELFMLSGEISISGHRLKCGDYCRAAAGTLHDPVAAETDCLFIALTALDNEFVPAASG